MPSKRPTPLSEDALNNAKTAGGGAAAALPVFAPANGATLLGETNNGVPLPVKNTFIDVPSGFTPSNMRSAKYQPLMSAPPDLNVNAAPGFLQRAMAASTASGLAPTSAAVAAAGMVPSSPLATGGTIGGGYGTRRFSQTPLATPSPSAALGFSQWAAASGSTAPVPNGPALQPTYGAIGTFSSAQPGLPLAHAQPMHFQAFSPKAGNIRTSVPEMFGQPVMKPDEEDDEDDDDEDEVPHHLRNMADAPQPPPGAIFPSLGSDGHEEGTCKRCCFFPRGRCTNGYNCEFCHFEHEKRKRKNKKKKKKDGTSIAATALPTTGTVVMNHPQVAGMPQPMHATMMQQAPPQVAQAMPPHLQQLPPQACSPTQHLQQLPPQACSPTQQQNYMAYPPSPDRAAQQQQQQQLVLGTQGFPPPQQAPQQHHVIYGPTHAENGFQGGSRPVAPLQAFMGVSQPPAAPMLQQMQPAPQFHPAMQPHPAPQFQPNLPQQGQGFAPPPFQPPVMAPAGAEPTPPPPMLSPKLGQATVQGAMIPPPAASPKFARPMMPPVDGLALDHRAVMAFGDSPTSQLRMW
eukprot:CAMPEP_0197661492 /NCGR_PEP_ID=MMETSP1338-20131121/51489_1 /TAXON_ID=43686 ORGANISM="Pelagodinium beii, Strain RCC1491" /NCGR_SAMPLE_ID=MMETSP1338 /ASSEMBLY_ACC=CAM_ASM_000754 /LENGTH=571 /DNA_ID=CAMNT_0043239057 /DNA_START=96 /DNA_END=1809 /DNA_ORIENTATION=-